MKLTSFLLFAILLSACSKDNPCIDSVIGSYPGHLYTTSNNVQGELIISKIDSGDSNVSIFDDMINAIGVTYTGTLSSDCTKITVPDQSITIEGEGTVVISGIFDIYGTSVNGSLIYNNGSIVNLTYVLVKM